VRTRYSCASALTEEALVAQAISANELTYGFLPIVKVVKDEADPSVRYVYGCATNAKVDSDLQIVDPAFAKKAMADWYDTGANVRQMHATTLPPAGKGVTLESQPDGEYVRTKVVEPVAVKLVDEGVYSGYSVGISHPRIVRDAAAPGGRIVGGRIVELSLVDRPANSTAKFAVLKMAGRGRGRKLTFVGKAVSMDRRPTRVPVPGTRVTVHARDEFGDLAEYHGRIAAKGVGSIALDEGGFTEAGATRFIDLDHVEAIYKGAVPLLTKGGDVNVDIHAGHGHGHGHDSEDSVADKPDDDAQVQPDAAANVDDTDDDGDDDTSAAGDTDDDSGPGDAPDAKKAGGFPCKKCKGSGQFGGADCAKCGGSGKAQFVKGVGVEQRDGQWAVVKGGVVLGTHPGSDAAYEQRDAVVKAAKEAKQAESAAQKAAKAAEPKADKAAKAAQRAAKKAARKAAKADKAAKVTPVPDVIRAAHDLTCGAYRTDALKAVRPDAASAIGPDLRLALMTEIAQTVNADGGSGTSGPLIAALGKAVSGIDLIDDAADVLAAREALVKGFEDANPNSLGKPGDYPKPSETITPGQFRRAFIKDGQEDPGGTSHAAAKIPTTTHPVRADQFDRGPLTDGHQRPSASKAMSLIHDGIADWRPDLCLMDAGGSNAFDRQPAVPRDGGPSLTAVPNKDASAPASIEIPASRRAPGEKGAVPRVALGAGRGIVNEVPEALIAAAVTKAVEPLLGKIASLETSVESLSAAPDYSRAAHRGTGVANKVATVSSAPKASRKDGRKQDRIEYLQSMTRSSDPEARIRAQDRLDRLGVAVE
jgi:hypothetical protein